MKVIMKLLVENVLTVNYVLLNAYYTNINNHYY